MTYSLAATRPSPKLSFRPSRAELEKLRTRTGPRALPWSEVTLLRGTEEGDSATSKLARLRVGIRLFCGGSRGVSPLAVRLAWEGDFEAVHSLAIVNRAICRGLLDRGHDVRLITGTARTPVGADERVELDDRLLQALSAATGAAGENGDAPPFDAQVHVRHLWPPALEPPAHGKSVLMQPWEYGSLPKAWLPMVQRADEIWAYSRSVRDCYLEAEVPRERVHVMPLGVAPEVFQPGLEPLPLAPGSEMRFLFVGGTIYRKGIDLLLTAFARAFRPGDGVGLVIKEMGSKSSYRGQTAEAQIAAFQDRGYAVEYIDRALSEAEMAGLYSACDCLVHPFRGEGFGLPVVEAMACGLPVIVTGAGPALDYASEDTAYLIPAERRPFPECRVGDLETVARPWLFEPDIDALVELLKRVACDRAAARAIGMAASAHIREQFTWARTVDAVEARLTALAGLSVGRAFQPDTVFIPNGPDRDRPENQSAGVRQDCLTYGGRAKVSLTMIVRNEEDNLPHALESVREVFDEIVIVDTGSNDRTMEIARSFGAKVFEFAWIDDFAAARNEALAHATGDYAFWLDADDVVDPAAREKLEGTLQTLRAGEETAFVVRCACDPSPDGSGGDTVVDHIRLFPLRDDVRWTYRVHEQILPSLNRAKVPVRWTDVTVRHTGYVDSALRSRKLDRDTKILMSELEARPDEPFILFNLGSIAVERQAWPAALGYLKRSLARSAPTDSIVRKLYALIARVYQMTGETREALRACAEGLRCDPENAELWFRKAVVHRHRGESTEAENSWRRILTLKRPEKYCSFDQGIYGHLTKRSAWRCSQSSAADFAEAEKALARRCSPTAPAIGRQLRRN